jgi:26S proteasome regulatory subunit N2
MMNFLSLALAPTALIGLNKNLKVPKNFKCISNAKPSTFKYPEFIKIDKDKKKEKVTTAVLSTTTKAKARKDRKEGKTGAQVNASEIGTPLSKKNTIGDDGNKNVEMEDVKKNDEEEKEVEEPDFQELKNPCRVLK